MESDPEEVDRPRHGKLLNWFRLFEARRTNRNETSVYNKGKGPRQQSLSAGIHPCSTTNKCWARDITKASLHHFWLGGRNAPDVGECVFKQRRFHRQIDHRRKKPKGAAFFGNCKGTEPSRDNTERLRIASLGLSVRT